MLIRTPRFTLRDFRTEDRAAFVSYQMDPRYRGLYDAAEGEGDARALFDLFLAWRRISPRENYQFGIFEAEAGRLCGCAGLRQAGAPPGTAVLGIELTPDDWGRYRLAIDVVDALLEFGFSELDLSSIVGGTASGNRPNGDWLRPYSIQHRAQATGARSTGISRAGCRGWCASSRTRAVGSIFASPCRKSMSIRN